MKKLLLGLFSIFFLFYSCEMENNATEEAFEIVNTSIPANPQENQLPINEQKLIKEAILRFPTDNLDETRKLLFTVIQQQNAYISAEKSYSSVSEKLDQIIIKVPAIHFDSLIRSIEILAGTLEVKDISVKDVTSEYIDLEARINNKRKLEQRFLQLLNRTDSIEEILKIEKKIAEVREDIEKSEGRINYLTRKVSYSHIEVVYYKEMKTIPTFSAEISSGFINGWKYIKGLVIVLSNIWPIVLLTVVGWLLLRERKVLGKRKLPSIK